MLAVLLLLPRELPLLSLDWERKPVTHQERFLCSSSPAGWIPAEGHFVKHVCKAKNKQTKNRKKSDLRHTYPLGNVEVIWGPPHCVCIKSPFALRHSSEEISSSSFYRLGNWCSENVMDFFF